MTIVATTPTRIDLAGGTLDIWPLYLFEGGGVTVNLAIDLVSRATVRPLPGRAVRLVSRDGSVGAAADGPEAVPAGGELDLLSRAVRHFAAAGLELETENTAPRGSGVGASSSLLIAICAALARHTGRDLPPEQLVTVAADLEAQTIGIPTGKQDYYAAVHGGVNAIWFEAGGNRVEPLVTGEAALTALEDRLVLSFTGRSRASAVTNWTVMKAYIDGVPATRQAMARIKEVALAARDALQAGDADRLAALVGEEWENRRNLGPGVSTPAVEALMAAAAGAGGLASKLCGAGGGGCMVTVTAPGRRGAVAAALAAAGARILPFRIARRGLVVEAGHSSQ